MDNCGNIVFLDIDGVLNSREVIIREQKKENLEAIDPHCVHLLNVLCRQHEAGVVISSSWRIGRIIENLSSMLRRFGFSGQVVGMTPEGTADTRGTEIKTWILCAKRTPDHIVILDDEDFDMGDMKPWVCKTDMAKGFCQDDLRVASGILESSFVVP